MLFDPKWEVKTRNAFSFESLIAWLETMPPDAAYDFQDCDGFCLVGQYMAANDTEWNFNVYNQFRNAFSEQSKHLPCTVFRIGAGHPWTFGAALSRARAALVPSAHRGLSE